MSISVWLAGGRILHVASIKLPRKTNNVWRRLIAPPYKETHRELRQVASDAAWLCLQGTVFRLCLLGLTVGFTVRAYFLCPCASKAASSSRMNAEERREIVGTVSSLAKTLADAMRRS